MRSDICFAFENLSKFSEKRGSVQATSVQIHVIFQWHPAPGEGIQEATAINENTLI